MKAQLVLGALACLVLMKPAAPVRAEEHTPESAPQPPFVAADFAVPTSAEGPGFRLVPLGPDLAAIDHAAYMSSIAHLQQTFTRSTNWPREGITMDEAMADMRSEAARFERRESFAYAVLTPDGLRERGCVYVYPGTGTGHDAVVRLWVTRAEYDAGFDAALYGWTRQWIAADWPFRKVAYPGRAIAWEEWDAMVAAARAD
jgi:hypothetical protein